jgi:6-pyruvoyl-tetrahydropterin synthase
LYDKFLINTNQKLDQLPKNKQHQMIYDFNFLKQYIAIKISDLQRDYLVERKQIDKKFLERVYRHLFDYPKNLLTDLQKNKKGY